MRERTPLKDMRDRKPRGLWDQVRHALLHKDEDREQADPSLAFHLMFTAPLALAVIVLFHRAVS
jgi:hypothetical protein